MNTGYRFIKFTFVSNSDNVWWVEFCCIHNKPIFKNGNVFKNNSYKIWIIETNYKYIKLSFISDPLFTSTGFEISKKMIIIILIVLILSHSPFRCKKNS